MHFSTEMRKPFVYNSKAFSLCFSGTSNWTEDYFSDSAGISITLEPLGLAAKNGQKWTFLKALQGIFERDWRSKLATPLQ